MERSQDMLVGLVALGAVPWIGWTLRRGLAAGRLPIGKRYVERGTRPGAYRALIAFYAAAMAMMAFIAADLILGSNG